MKPQSELLTTAEVAERLKVHPVTVARWVRSGKLAAVHLPGGRLRFHAVDIDALVNGDAA